MQPFLLHSRKDVLADSVKQAMIQALLLIFPCMCHLVGLVLCFICLLLKPVKSWGHCVS